MRSLNRVYLAGVIHKSPELRTTQTGMQMATIFIDTAEGKRGQEVTETHKILCFGDLAREVQSTCIPGRFVTIVARVSTKKREGKDGKEYVNTDLMAQSVLFGDELPAQETAAPGNPIDDIPF